MRSPTPPLTAFRAGALGWCAGWGVLLSFAGEVTYGQCDCGPPPAVQWPGTPWIVGGPIPVVPVEAGPMLGPPHQVSLVAAPNCNFAVRATEDFANRIVARCQTQNSPVRDFILGADVFGDQSTTTHTRLDFKPCATAAKFELQVNGDVESRTVGVTRQAQIQTLGRHHFLLSKEIEFDGRQVRTRSPAVTVTPSQRHVGAMTSVSTVPIIGPIANNIALQAATARNPAAAQITAGKITQQAAPEFNTRVDTELARLNELLSGKAREQLVRFGLAPSAHSLSSSERDLLWCVTLDVPTTPPPLPVDATTSANGRAGAIYLHDTLVNDLLARLPLKGIGVPDAAIDRWFRALASGEGLEALSRRGAPIEPNLATIVFDDVRPIQLRFEDNQFALILRLGFRPVAGPEIATQEIMIPFRVELSGEAVLFQPGEVRIAPGDPSQPGGVLDDAARTLIRQQVQARLEARSAPRRIPVQLPDTPASEVRVSRVQLEGGWLSVLFD